MRRSYLFGMRPDDIERIGSCAGRTGVTSETDAELRNGRDPATLESRLSAAQAGGPSARTAECGPVVIRHYGGPPGCRSLGCRFRTRPWPAQRGRSTRGRRPIFAGCGWRRPGGSRIACCLPAGQSRTAQTGSGDLDYGPGDRRVSACDRRDGPICSGWPSGPRGSAGGWDDCLSRRSSDNARAWHSAAGARDARPSGPPPSPSTSRSVSCLD